MLVLWLHVVLQAATLAGVARRQRGRASSLVVVFLVFALASKLAHIDGIITPARWLPYLFEQFAQSLLALATAIELGARIFHQHLATGRAYVARGVVAVLLLGLVVAISWGLHVGAARTDADLYYALVDAERRLAGTALCVFLVVFALAMLRFHWPIDPYHRDIALGFGLYLAGVLLVSPAPHMPVRLPESWPVWLYSAALLLWLRAAWRRDDFSGVAPRFRPVAFPWARHDS